MRNTVAILGAAAVLAAMGEGADDPAPCRLRKGLYEQRLALASPPHDAGTDAAAGAPASDGNGSSAPVSPREALDREYYGFFRGLAEASDAKDTAALKTCRTDAGEDRIGLLSCQLVSYVSGGRSDSAGFLGAFPSGRKEIAALWELDALAAGAIEHGAAVPKAFLPKGPSYRFIDELFLLVLDGNEEAITRYFNLAGYAGGENARYMDEKLALLFREAQSVLVSKWFVLRRHRQKLKSALQAAAVTPAENQRIRRGIHAFCGQDDPDCAEILKLLGKR